MNGSFVKQLFKSENTLFLFIYRPYAYDPPKTAHEFSTSYVIVYPFACYVHEQHCT